MIKIKTSITNIQRSYREVVLKKFTSQAISSESFFALEMKQPKNTCPMIDDVIRALDEHREPTKKLLDAMEAMIPVEKESSGSCNCGETLKSTIKKLREYEKALTQCYEGISEIENDLEDFRADCINLRDYGSQIKDLYWGVLSKEVSPYEIKTFFQKEEKPKLKKEQYKIEEAAEALKKRSNLFLSHDCREGCENSKVLVSLEDFMTELYNWNLSGDVHVNDVDLAYDNYYKLVSWVEELEALADKLPFSSSEEDFRLSQEFVDILNADNKKFFEDSRVAPQFASNLKNFVKNKTNSAEYVRQFEESSENYTLGYKMSLWSKKKEALVEEAISVYDRDDLSYESAVSSTEMFYEAGYKLDLELRELITSAEMDSYTKTLYSKLSHELGVFLSYFKDHGAKIFSLV